MVAHTSRRPDPTGVEPHRVSWRRRLIWLLTLLAAATVAAVAGVVLAEQLTPSSSGAPAAQRGPTADSRELPGRGSASGLIGKRVALMLRPESRAGAGDRSETAGPSSQHGGAR
jgi:hypothetical protein